MLEGHREKALQKKGKGKGKESEDTDEKTEVDDEEKAPEKKWIRQIRVGTFEDSGKCKGWVKLFFKPESMLLIIRVVGRLSTSSISRMPQASLSTQETIISMVESWWSSMHLLMQSGVAVVDRDHPRRARNLTRNPREKKETRRRA